MTKAEHLKNLIDKKNSNSLITNIFERVQIMKGEKGDVGPTGYSPIKGKDYFTEKEINTFTDFIQSRVKNGKDGAQGIQGVKGDSPIRGVDFWTIKDQTYIIENVLSLIPKPKDGITPNVDEVVSKAVSEIQKRPINFKDIKGTEQLVEFLKLGGFRGGGGSSSGGTVGPGTANQIAYFDTTTTVNSLTTATYPSLAELSYVKGVTSAIQTQIDAKGAGTVTSVATGTGLTGGAITGTGTIALSTPLQPMATLTGNALKFLRVNAGETALEYAAVSGGGITIGTTTITSGANTKILYDNSGVVGEYTISGSGNVAMTTSPVFTTPNIGSATGSISGNAGTATALANARTIAGVSFDGTANIAIAASNLSNGVTGSGAIVLAGSPTLTTAILGSSTATTQTPGDNSTKLATTAYVDAAVLGQDFKEAVGAATTANLVGVYLNGSSGVGATFTYTATGADVVDGVTLTLGMRVLLKNQTTDLQNGIYTVTTAGGLGIAGVLTRATDGNQSFEWKTGDSLFVTAGTTLANTTWAYNGIDSPTMGTTSLTFVQVAGQGSFTAGNGITITGTSIAIDTTVTADLSTAQTFTNKTLTSPKINENVALTTTATKLNYLTSAGGTTGTTSTNIVFSTSPTLVTPTLGVASATTINRVTLTAPATGSTLTIIDGKTLTVNKTISFTAADDTGVYTLPTGTKTLAATDVATLSSLTSIGTIGTGVWQGTAVGIAYGGTGGSITASNGGIVYSDASRLQLLSGTATARKVLLSQSSVAPIWSTETYAAPGTSGNVMTSDGTNWTSAAPASGSPMTLLKAGSGTNTTTTANNLDTIAITGLTAKDTILIFYTVSMINNTANATWGMYSSTDSTFLLDISNGAAFGQNNTYGGQVVLRNQQEATTSIFASGTGNSSSSSLTTTGAVEQDNFTRGLVQTTAVTTAWTGSWTLAFRSGGVVSGGTMRWSWSVFKLAGQ